MKKHSIISMGLALVLVCSSLSPMGVMAKEPVQSEMEVVGAATPEELGFSVRDAGDGTLEIENVFDKECTEIVIPAEVDGKKITRIGNDAFQGCGTEHPASLISPLPPSQPDAPHAVPHCVITSSQSVPFSFLSFRSLFIPRSFL